MTYSRGPAHPPTRPMHRVLAGLIAQRIRCGGDKCGRRNCRRCNRGKGFRRKEGHTS
jgi:hypothetical protein